MKYEKGIDGSYCHNNIIIRRDDDPRGALFDSGFLQQSGKTISAFLNGYAIIPMKEYCELTGREYNDKFIKEADKQLHDQKEDCLE